MTQIISNKDSDNRAREQGIRVLLLDTPKNEGVDFLQKLSQQSVELVSQRLGAHQALADALEKDSWDILLVNDRLASPTTEEILAAFRQTHSETGLVFLSSGEVNVENLTKAYQQALVRLGVQPVNNFVMLAAQQRAFTAENPFLQTMMEVLWKHAAASANACRWTAEKCGHIDTADDAFLAGLLHDLGSLVVLKAIDELTSQGQVVDLSTEVIKDVMASLHTEFGHRFMQSWQLPPEYADIARDHHAARSDAANVLLNIVRLVDAACSKVGFGMELNPDLSLEALDEAVMLGIKDVHLAELELEQEDMLEGGGETEAA